MCTLGTRTLIADHHRPPLLCYLVPSPTGVLNQYRVSLGTDSLLCVSFCKKYIKDVSREFDEFQVNTHLCKLLCWHL